MVTGRIPAGKPIQLQLYFAVVYSAISMSRSLGNKGENIAVDYLKANGFDILDRNFTIRGGEIDIVARDGAELVFVEVKTRRSRSFGSGEDSVNFFKLKNIHRAARRYCSDKKFRPEFRIDVVDIQVTPLGGVEGIEHFRDVGSEF
ncbi:MAG: YraN family protein [Patescibacteria group bacterium]